jgi:hypothetical protein
MNSKFVAMANALRLNRHAWNTGYNVVLSTASRAVYGGVTALQFSRLTGRALQQFVQLKLGITFFLR